MVPNRLLKEGITDSDKIDKLSPEAEIEDLFRELSLLPSDRLAGIARTRIYGRIRALRLRLARTRGTHTKTEWACIQALCGFSCLDCGAHHPLGLTKDHLVPLSKGGSDSIANIRPICGRCNSAKGDR